MSKLVYFKNQMGSVDAQIWHGPPYLGEISLLQKNDRGNFMTPSAGGDRILRQIEIKDGEEKLGIDKLVELYPLKEKT